MARRMAWDLVACEALVLASVAAGTWLAPGALRLMLCAPALLVCPGYLLLRATLPRGTRVFQLLFALGLSPAVVGLAALATAVAPDGFRLPAIMAAVALCCTLLAGAAWLHPAASALRTPSEATAAQLD